MATFRGARRSRFAKRMFALAALVAIALAAAAVISRRNVHRPITIAAADFELGANDGDSDEKPAHRVHVNAFAIDRHEVTVAEYGECVAQQRCTPPGAFHAWCVAKSGGGRDLPINCVTYQQATAYCAFRGGRLPSELEWEHAARGSDQRRYPWGSAAPTDQACWQSKQPCPIRVNGRDRSPFGLSDMAGNVSEWTSSAYCNYADPKQCKVGVRVTRGGSFDLSDAQYLRTTYRDWVREADAGYNLGMRCAFDITH